MKLLPPPKTSAKRRIQPQGGYLQNGNPGNAGGTGRPPSLVRARCRDSFEARIPILEQIADGEPIVKTQIMAVREDGSTETLEAKVSASPADRVRALDLLGKYGGIEKLSIDLPRDGTDRTGEESVAALVMMLPRLFAVIPIAKRDKVKMLRAIRVKEADLAVNE